MILVWVVWMLGLLLPAGAAQAGTLSDGSVVTVAADCRAASPQLAAVVEGGAPVSQFTCRLPDNIPVTQRAGMVVASVADAQLLEVYVASWQALDTTVGTLAFPVLQQDFNPLPDNTTGSPAYCGQDLNGGTGASCPSPSPSPSSSPDPSSSPSLTPSPGPTSTADATPSPAPSGSTASAADLSHLEAIGWATFGLLTVLGGFGLFLGALHVVGRMLS